MAQVSLSPDFLLQVLRGHILHLLDGQLGVFRGYAKMPHSPYRISKMGVHEDLYPLSQCGLLSLAHLAHAGAEIRRA